MMTIKSRNIVTRMMMFIVMVTIGFLVFYGSQDTAYAATDVNTQGIFVYKYQKTQTYTGKAIKPAVKVYYGGEDGMDLTAEQYGEMFVKISYKEIVSPGTYDDAITITGVGPQFTGTKKLPVTIVKSGSSSTITKKKFSKSNSAFRVSTDTTRKYTGKLVKPSVKVVYSGKTLVKGTDYTVNYRDMKYPGTYSKGIKITGKGKYEGTVTYSVKIKAPVVSTKVTKVSTTKSAPYVKYKEPNIKGAKITYKVQYKTSANGSWKTAAKATTKSKLKIKGLAKKKAYAIIVTPKAKLNKKTYTGKAALSYKKISKPSGTAISSGSDLIKKINANPNGKFYLTSSVTVPFNKQVTERFKGTFNGNGFTLKNFKYKKSGWNEAGLFQEAWDAKFINVKMTGANVSVSSKKGARVGTLVGAASNCTFKNVRTYGVAKVSGKSTSTDSADYNVGGIVGRSTSCNYSNCTNDVDVTASCSSRYDSIEAGGISAMNVAGTMKNCKNTGNIKVSGHVNYYTMNVGGLLGGGVDTIKSCKNSGKVSITVGAKGKYVKLNASGICGDVRKDIAKCKNTGTVSVVSKTTSIQSANVCGVVGQMTTTKGKVLKCANKGAVKYSGKAGDEDINIGGISAVAGNVYQCYNKGKVSCTQTSGFANVGGIAGVAYDLFNSYNTGKVYLRGKGFAGGLAGNGNIYFGKAYRNYNTGAVSGAKGAKKGAIFGHYSGHEYEKTTYSNYYTNSIKALGSTAVTNKYKPSSIKVSSITKSKCPKLSSKYWKYSSKRGRMVLRYNPE